MKPNDNTMKSASSTTGANKTYVGSTTAQIVSPTKKNISKALREVGTALWQLTLFNALMDSLVVFTIAFLIFSLINLPWYASFLVLLIYGGIHTYNTITRLSFNIVESKVPALRERLITAADNLDKDNEITQSLNEEVLKLLKDVKTSYFLSFGRLTRQLVVLSVLSFLIIGTAAYNVQLLDYTRITSLIQESVTTIGDYELKPEEMIFKEENQSKDIFGNKSIATLGTKELQLQINPVLSDIDITKQKDRKPQEFQEVPPQEIGAKTDKAYGESIPKGYQKIVKSYFKEISKQQT